MHQIVAVCSWLTWHTNTAFQAASTSGGDSKTSQSPMSMRLSMALLCLGQLPHDWPEARWLLEAVHVSGGAWVQGGYTRILHSGKGDDLMDEIPTFVAQQLPREQNGGGAYIVINRPYAFVQWTSQ